MNEEATIPVRDAAARILPAVDTLKSICEMIAASGETFRLSPDHLTAIADVGEFCEDLAKGLLDQIRASPQNN